ncbi:hypothetical protein K438DRAFT_245182 [Mycena galopus ATCC 62051]|nr:hypothetical protein K438DRAFT_245182 [Mycena galopus ATCC 62051]
MSASSQATSYVDGRGCGLGGRILGASVVRGWWEWMPSSSPCETRTRASSPFFPVRSAAHAALVRLDSPPPSLPSLPAPRRPPAPSPRQRFSGASTSTSAALRRERGERAAPTHMPRAGILRTRPTSSESRVSLSCLRWFVLAPYTQTRIRITTARAHLRTPARHLHRNNRIKEISRSSASRGSPCWCGTRCKRERRVVRSALEPGRSGGSGREEGEMGSR